MLRLVETHDFIFLVNTQTDRLVENERDDQGYDEGVCSCGHNRDQLDHQLLEIARQQAGGADRGKDAGHDRAEGTANAMYAEGIKRIVIFEFGFQHDAAIAYQTGHQAHQQGCARLYKTGSRGDDNQTGDDAGTETEGARLAGVDPFGDHPGKTGGGRGYCRGGDGQTGQTARGVGRVDTDDGRTGVEAEPAEPEQADAQQGQRQIVRS